MALNMRPARVAARAARGRQAPRRATLLRPGAAAVTPAPTTVEAIPRGDEWQVHKYGGTSVGSAERILAGAKLMMESEGARKLLVVSAMGGVPKVTDLLLDVVAMASNRDPEYGSRLEALREKHVNTANELLGAGSAECDAFIAVLDSDISDLKSMLKAMSIAGMATTAFEDFVVGHGEIWSAQMMAAVISKNGGNATWMDAREVLIVEDTADGSVDVDYEASNAKLDEWWAAKGKGYDIIVATGFVASTHEGLPTTLKRNGSDYSATILGALLQSAQITIWTDVDGVYSADPRKVPEAVCLDSLSYNEAWELSYFGANVLHPRTTLPAMKYGIPVTLRNIFNLSEPGTRIGDELPEKKEGKPVMSQLVKGFATIDNVTLINVEGTGMVGVPGTASAIFSAVKAANVNVVMISQASSEHSLCFAVKENDAVAAVDAVNAAFGDSLDAGRIQAVTAIPGNTILAAVGQQMCSVHGVSAMLFDSLAKASINVRAVAQGCSEYNITVVVDQKDSARALSAVHSRFYLSETPIAVGIVGPGLIGKTLLAQIAEQMETLKTDFGVDLRVLGICDSKRMLLDDIGLDLLSWEEDWAGDAPQALDADAFTAHMSDSSFPNMVMIDCTASGVVGDQYLGWLEKGIHVITPNKKANSGPYDYYKKIRDLGRESYTHYFYEGTVGAGLPIVSTLRGLKETGDNATLIQGIFSGTLSYIFNTWDGSQNFSDVVSQAKDAGYTEPDPRDDLNGMDVARKVVILAREAGLQLELDDVPVENLVPEALRGTESIEEFMSELPKYDAEMAQKLADAKAKGKVLRFVGVVDVVAGTGEVVLKEYDEDHPFAQLQGSDNIISFQTKRYSPPSQPLVVRGPGAGAEVTAGGVFADLLRLAAYLGAPS